MAPKSYYVHTYRYGENVMMKMDDTRGICTSYQPTHPTSDFCTSKMRILIILIATEALSPKAAVRRLS